MRKAALLAQYTVFEAQVKAAKKIFSPRGSSNMGAVLVEQALGKSERNSDD